MSTPLLDYLAKTAPDRIDNATVAYLANLTEVAKVSPGIAGSIVRELADQRRHLKLIASENSVPPPGAGRNRSVKCFPELWSKATRFGASMARGDGVGCVMKGG